MVSAWDELEEVKIDDWSQKTPVVKQNKNVSPWDELEEIKPENPIDDEFNIDFEEPKKNTVVQSFGDKVSNVFGKKNNKSNLEQIDYQEPYSEPVGFKNNVDEIYDIPQVPLPYKAYNENNGWSLDNVKNNGQALLQGGVRFVEGANDVKNKYINNPLVSAGRSVARAVLPKNLENKFIGSLEDEKLLKQFNGVEFPSYEELSAQYQSGAISKDDYLQTMKDKLAVENARLDKNYRDWRNTEWGKEGLLLGLSAFPLLAAGGAGAGAATASTAANASNLAKIANVLGASAKTGLVEGAKFGGLYGLGSSVIDKNANPITQPLEDAALFGVTNAVLNPVVTTALAAGKAAAPYIKNGIKEGISRLNPKNYVEELVAEPVEKGMGLSRKTVYEGKTKRVYKPEQNNLYEAREVNPKKISDNGTGFTMGEGSDLNIIAPKTMAKRSEQDLPAVYNTPTIAEPIAKSVKEEHQPKRYKVVDGKTVEVLEDGSYKELSNKYAKIAPKTVEQIEQVKNTENLQANETVGQEGNTNNDIENIAKEYSQMLGQNEVRDFHRDFAAALVNKNADKIKNLVAQGRGMNENSKKMFTKYTGIKLPSTIQGKKDIIDKWANGEINSETAQEEVANSLIPSYKYKVTVHKNGLTADGLYMEGNNFHTDGNAAYLKEFVNADTSKVERVTKATESAEQQIKGTFEKTGNYTLKAEDIGKGIKRNKETWRALRIGEYENGEPKYVVINDKYLLDKKDIELYVDDDNWYAPISIRKNGKQIGVVMPIVQRNGFNSSDMTDIKPLKYTAKKANQIPEAGKKVETNQDVDANKKVEGELPETKKTTVTMKSGKEKEIEYVEEVPEGFVEDVGAMTAPKGYTWYHNNKSILSGEHKRILVKDKAAEENSVVDKTEETAEPKDVKKSEPKKKETTEKSEKYEDYGEKIHGARKDIWQSYNETLAKKLPESYEEFTKTKLSDVFPDINGDKFIENGGDSDTAAVIKLLRDSIPTKPSGRKAMLQHYRNEWTNAIKEHREYTQKLLNGEMTADEVVNKLVYNDKNIDFDMIRKADAYRAVGYPACKNIKGYMLDKGGVSVKDEKTGEYKKEERWYVTRENRFGLRPFKTREEAIDYLKEVAGVNSTPAKREAKLEIGRWSDDRKANGYIIYYKAGTGKYIELKNKFETAKEAKEYLNAHKEELLDQLNKLKEEPPMRGEVNEPRIGKGFRNGKNVNPEEFSKTFGFRGVQFGNYVEGTKRIEDINNAYDSLMDMSEVLNIPEKAISLNGELGLAFGARGRGGKHAASAHYEPAEVVINLTKNKGAGSLAHEWWHALDNYFGKKNKGEMATETYGTRTPEFREEMAKAYSDVKSAVRKAIYSRSKELDNTRSRDYWSTDVEMTARAFETYIKHKIDSQGFSNDYLANIIGEDVYKNLGREGVYPYPTKAEMPEIEKAFDKFFDTIKTRETDKGVELYSVDLPEFMKNAEEVDTGYKDLDLTPIYERISKGIKGAELAEILPKEIGDIISEDAKNYTFGEMVNKDPKFKGLHNGKKATIILNLDAIGNSPYSFIETLTHEVRHAYQEKLFLQIMAKPRHTWTPEERIFVAHFNIAKRVNKKWQKHYNRNKELINKFDKKHFSSAKERADAISKLKPSEQEKIDINDKNLEEYWNLFKEVDARAEGVKNATGYRKKSGYTLSRAPKTKRAGFGFTKKRNLLANDRDNSIEPSGYKRGKEINDVIRDKVYEWHGNLESDRYDVDKSLNSFVQLTKHRAAEFSKKLGIKVSDKQIREIMPFLRERTGFPKSLDRDDLRTLFNKLSGADKAELAKLADTISDKFEKYYTNYKDAKGEQTTESIENHISHLWKEKDKKKSLLTNYITTNSKFAKKRTIGTLVEGIDGIEINGEIVKFEPRTLDYAEILKSSSDNLIKATHDSNLANTIKSLEYNGEKLIQPASKAPDEWIEVNHPALNKAVYMGSVGEDELPMLMKTPVKVHPEIADYVSAIFETQKNSGFWDMFDALNGMVKQGLLGFSGFHGYALSESAVGNAGLRKTLKELNPKKFIDAIKNGNYDVYKNEEAAKRAINAGVQLGTPSDLQRNLVEETLKKVPFLGKYLAGAVSANNKILWDVLHNNFKVMTYNIAVENLGGNVTKEQERAIAQWVNDSFGGQAWELLGVKKSAIKAASRVLLSPDWNFSTIRQAAAAINSDWLNDALGQNQTAKRIGKLTGIGEEAGSKGARGKIGRGFWIRSALYFTVFYNLMNAAFREKDRKEHPDLYPSKMSSMDYSIWSNSYPMDSGYDKLMPKVFIGRNSDGTARMLRVGKQFREVPEFITEPVSKLGGKTSPLINTISQTILGMSPADIVNKSIGKDAYLNQDIWNGYGENARMREGMDLAKGRAKALGKSLVPYIGSKYIGGKHEFSAWDFFAQTSAGASKSNVYKQAKAAFENGEIDKILELKRQAYRDGLKKSDINKMVGYAEKNYKAENTMEYKSQFVSAIEKKDKAELNRIKGDMEKHKLSAAEQRRIYENAWKDYRKK